MEGVAIVESLRSSSRLTWLGVLLTALVAGGTVQHAPAVPQFQVNLTLMSGDGTALSGAPVAVHLMPFNPTPIYRPVQIARGTTSGTGQFGFDIDTTLVRGALGDDELAEGVDNERDSFDAMVRAVDPDREWLLVHMIQLSIDDAVTQELNAAIELQQADPLAEERTEEDLIGPGIVSCIPEVDEEDTLEDEVEGDPGIAVEAVPDHDPIEPVCGKPQVEPNEGSSASAVGSAAECVVNGAPCQVDTTRKWVAVFPMHVAKGMRGKYVYTRGEGRTLTQWLHKFGSGNWSVQGMKSEEQERSSTATVTKEDAFHRAIYARYRWYKWNRIQDPGNGPCPGGGDSCLIKEYWWSSHHWTGGMCRKGQNDCAKRGKTDLTVPEVNLEYAEKLGNISPFTRKENNSHTFGAGVSFFSGAIMLDARAGFFTNTAMTWTKIDGCGEGKTRWLWGSNSKDITEAPTVYARCDN